ACSLNLAPTSSTAVTLALGDALAVVLMSKKNFRAEDFARSHPGGALGRKLVTVKDVMRSGVSIPIVSRSAKYPEALTEIGAKKLGFTTVCDAEGRLAGMVTDGDVRRAAVKFGPEVFSQSVEEIMTTRPKTIEMTALAAEALKL